MKTMQAWSVGLRLEHGKDYRPDEAEHRLEDLAEYFPVISIGPDEVSFRLTVTTEKSEEAIVKAIRVVGAGCVSLGECHDG